MANEAAIKAAFSKFDSDNNGLISYEELEAVFCGIGGFATPEDLRKIIQSVDEDMDGCINFNEFLALSMKLQSAQTEDSLKKLFAGMDQDGDRYLTRAELREGMSKFLGKDPSDEQIESALITLDVNQDGKVSYQEFANNFLCRLHTILDTPAK